MKIRNRSGLSILSLRNEIVCLFSCIVVACCTISSLTLIETIIDNRGRTSREGHFFFVQNPLHTS